jgi:peroxiredoxin Q/BCP
LYLVADVLESKNMKNVSYQSPEVLLPRDGGELLNLKEFRPKNVVLFFYPKDATPTCTKEAVAFSQAKAEFEKLNTVLVGISKDPVASHEKFIVKNDLNVPLLSDDGAGICEAFNVWKEKSMYGKTYMGIERSTFLIDGHGNIVKEWRKVRIKNHVEEVLDAVKKLLNDFP